MTVSKAKEILLVQINCNNIQDDRECVRNCSNCLLHQPTEVVNEALMLALGALCYAEEVRK